MDITWDCKKAKANWLKHRIHFSDAEVVLFDPYFLSIPDPDVINEERFIGIGTDGFARILTVVYCYKEENIRLISARAATKKERQYYESGI